MNNLKVIVILFLLLFFPASSCAQSQTQVDSKTPSQPQVDSGTPSQPQSNSGTVSRARSDSEHLFSQGADLMQSGEINKAITLLEQSAATDPSNPLPLIVLGDYYYKNGTDYKKAISYYARFLNISDQFVLRFAADALKRSADSYLALANRALWLDEKEDLRRFAENAVVLYEQALTNNFERDTEIKTTSIRLSMAHLYTLLGRYETASKSFEALEGNKSLLDSSEFFYYKGYFLRTQKNNKKAAGFLKAIPADSLFYAPGQELLQEIEKEKRSNLIFYLFLAFIVLSGGVFIWWISSSLKTKHSFDHDSPLNFEEHLEFMEGAKFKEVSDAISFAVAKFVTLLNIPMGFGFIPNKDNNKLVSVNKSIIGVMADNIDITLKYSFDDTNAWLAEGRGVPFIYKLERREVSYVRAFPDSHIELENILVRIGIPLIADGSFIGIIYLACDETPKLKREIRRAFERNFEGIRKLAEKMALLIKEAALHEAQYRDPVSGLYNKLYFEENFLRLLREGSELSLSTSLILIEIDAFDELKEKYGEPSAFRLRDLALDAVKKVVSPEVIICQFLEHRFALIMKKISFAEAGAFADRIKAALCGIKLTYQGDAITATIALGNYPETVKLPEDLEKQVMEILFQGIKHGGNIVLSSQKQLSSDNPPFREKGVKTPEPLKSAKNSIFHSVAPSLLSPGKNRIKSGQNSGMLSRSVMEQALAQEMRNLEISPTNVVFFYFGFDNYAVRREKNISSLVKCASEFWLSFLPEEGLLAKIEANGFTYLLTSISFDEAVKLGRSLLEKTAEYFSETGETISVGIAVYPDTTSNFKNIVISSRNAMLEAMELGGNQIKFSEG